MSEGFYSENFVQNVGYYYTGKLEIKLCLEIFQKKRLVQPTYINLDTFLTSGEICRV